MGKHAHKDQSNAWNGGSLGPPEHKTAQEEQLLFAAISQDIRSNSELYREAGEWLDQFYDIEQFWQRREKQASDLFTRIESLESELLRPPENWYCESDFLYGMIDRQAYVPIAELHERCKKQFGDKFFVPPSVKPYPPVIPYTIGDGRPCLTGEYCEYRIQEVLKSALSQAESFEDGVPIQERLYDACENLLCEDGVCPRDADARRTLLVSWLLTDPDAQELGLGLTEFENWDWESSRSHAKRAFQNRVVRKSDAETEFWHSWQKLVRVAGTKLNLMSLQSDIGNSGEPGQLCNEDVQRFNGIYKRLCYRIENPNQDWDPILANELEDFWPTLIRIAQMLNVDLSGKLETLCDILEQPVLPQPDCSGWYGERVDEAIADAWTEFEAEKKGRNEAIAVLDKLAAQVSSPGLLEDCQRYEDEWITISEAAEIMGKHTGTVSKYAKAGKIKSNGEERKKKRVSKISVLILEAKIKREAAERDRRELSTDARRTPERH